MKLRKKDRKRLESILVELERGQEYLLRPTTAVMVESGLMSTDIYTSSFYPDKRYMSINKQMGSLLCLLFTGVSNLRKALAEQEKEVVHDNSSD